MPDRGKARSAPGGLHLDEARRLMTACAGKVGGDAASVADAVEKTCRQVTAHLEPLIGGRAAQALLARAVYLSKPRFRILEAVSTAEPDADVARQLPQCLRGAAPAEALEAALNVVGEFVWLLTRFIGDEFGLRLLREACADRDEEKQ